ncbi:hypothetical protein CALCODRAFT_441694 [Calocera cornea HHB12733]|uniref:Uncharacterized protein n=1 Tax=Calocera cornea HHB12733 TaxID=1353952 RepID=A0A165D9S7_9BASI|nr:hypothetical protein CALCODRAFT_441694 [Calocera cornea HHB12733]
MRPRSLSVGRSSARAYAHRAPEIFQPSHPSHPPNPHPLPEKVEHILSQNPLEEPSGSDELQGGARGAGTGTGGGPEKPEKEEDLSDREWDIRVGNAIHHLRTTLPTFFETGLIIHPLPFIDPPSSSPSSPSSSPSPPGMSTTGKSLYSPNIRLSYTPPFPLPAPFPRTLHIEGLSLYSASARIVRATMTAFHHDLGVELRRMYVLSHGRRERAARILLTVSGFGRVTHARSEWDVNCTYTFSPTSGLISHHRIESIDPAPHISVYEGFKASLGRFLSGGAEGEAEGVGVPKRALEPARSCRGRDGGRCD